MKHSQNGKDVSRMEKHTLSHTDATTAESIGTFHDNAKVTFTFKGHRRKAKALVKAIRDTLAGESDK